MTISTTGNRTSTSGNGVTTAFSFPYYFALQTDLQVFVVTTATGAVATLLLSTDYTVTGAGAAGGGTVNAVVPPITGTSLVIVRTVSLLQATSWPNNTAFDGPTIEAAIDKITIEAQQVSNALGRSPALGIADIDGSGTYQANSNKISALGAPVAGTDAARLVDVQNAQAAVNNVPTPANPGDNTKLLQANAGTFSWQNPSGVTFAGTTTFGGTAVVTATQAAADNSTKIANTAFVQQELINASNVKAPIRQTFLTGKRDVNGYANWLSAGAALNFNVAATTTPLLITFAGGMDGRGDVNSNTVLPADANNQGALAANNTSYITATRTSAAAVTWGSTLSPPQYGYAYDQTKQSLLRFAGTNASTTILDDYGNTWAAAGNAQLSTGTLIDTLNTLALDGTGDWVDSTNITTLGSGSWTVEIKVRWPVLPPASTIQMIAEMSTSGFGMQLFLQADVTPTRTLRLNLSSNGTSNDIAILVGASTNWVAATTYHFAVCFDALTGKYFVYKDGVQDSTVTNALKIAPGSKMRIGANVSGTQGFNGNVAGFRFLPYCAYPNGVTFTPPTLSAFTISGVTSSDWYDTVAGVMYGPTVASASAGTNPTLTAKTVCYGGEADTSAGAVTATRNYAYQGKYISADTIIPGLGARTAFSSNIGTQIATAVAYIRNYTSDAGFTPGMTTIPSIQSAGAASETLVVSIEDRNTLSTVTGSATALVKHGRTTGTVTALTTANWKMFVTEKRDF